MKKIRRLSKKVSAGLLGVTLLASGAAAQNLGNIQQHLIDDDGAVSSSIVVGEDAKASDVVSAINIGTALGNDAYSNKSQTVEGSETFSVNGLDLENNIRSTVSGTLTATSFEDLVRNYEYGENDDLRVTETVRIGQVNSVGNTVSTTVDEDGNLRTVVNKNAVEYTADYQQGLEEEDSLYLLGEEYELTNVESDEITLGSTQTNRNLGTGDTVEHGPYTVEVTDNDGENTVYLTIKKDGETVAEETFTPESAEGGTADTETESFGDNDEFTVSATSVFFGDEERVTLETTYSDVTMTDGEEAPVDEDWIVDLDTSSNTVNSIGLYNQVKATAVDKDEEDYDDNQVAALSEGESLEGPNNFFTVQDLGLTEEATTELVVKDDKELEFTDANGIDHEIDWNNLYDGSGVSEGDEGFVAVKSDEGNVPVQYEVQTLNAGAGDDSTAAEIQFSYGGYEETLEITGSEYDGSDVAASSSGYGFQMAFDTSSAEIMYVGASSPESTLETEFGTEIAEGVFEDANGNQYQASILENLVSGTIGNLDSTQYSSGDYVGVDDGSGNYLPLQIETFSTTIESLSGQLYDSRTLDIESTYQQETSEETLSTVDSVITQIYYSGSRTHTLGSTDNNINLDLISNVAFQSGYSNTISAGNSGTVSMGNVELEIDDGNSDMNDAISDLSISATSTNSNEGEVIVSENGGQLDVTISTTSDSQETVTADIDLGSTDLGTYEVADSTATGNSGTVTFTVDDQTSFESLSSADTTSIAVNGNVQVQSDTVNSPVTEVSGGSASEGVSDVSFTPSPSGVATFGVDTDGASTGDISLASISDSDTATINDDFSYDLEMSSYLSSGDIKQDFNIVNSDAQVTDSDGSTLSSSSDVSGDLSFDNGNDRFSASFDADSDISNLLLDSGTGNSFSLTDTEDGASSLTRFGTSVELSSEEQASFTIPENQRQANLAVGKVSTGQGGDSSYNLVEPQGTSGVGALDSEVDTGQNLILVGGPDVNDLTEDLAEQGDSWTSDQYSEGEGLLQMVSDAFTDGYDALVVAGQTAEDTRAAGNYLAEYDEHLEELEGKSQAVIDSESGELVEE